MKNQKNHKVHGTEEESQTTVSKKLKKQTKKQINDTEEDTGPELIEITVDGLNMTEDTQLNLFKNNKFNGEKMIAPRSSGTFDFTIKNSTKRDVKYNIDFDKETKYPINMKYKLKMNNLYIRGSENDYVNVEDLALKDLIVSNGAENNFSIEWYWEDDDVNDTFIGIQEVDRYYKLNLSIYAEQYTNN